MKVNSYTGFVTYKNMKINLHNVSMIFVDDNKIVFNFSHSINIIGQLTPDYVYIKFNNKNEAIEKYNELIKSSFVQLNFYIPNNPNILKVVNRKKITVIKFIDEEMKIVFNLNYASTYNINGEERDIANFVYWKYYDKDEYEDQKYYFSRL